VRVFPVLNLIYLAISSFRPEKIKIISLDMFFLVLFLAYINVTNISSSSNLFSVSDSDNLIGKRIETFYKSNCQDPATIINAKV
jgi:hypothetical protein